MFFNILFVYEISLFKQIEEAHFCTWRYGSLSKIHMAVYGSNRSIIHERKKSCNLFDYSLFG